jgi:hypothetical protein
LGKSYNAAMSTKNCDIITQINCIIIKVIYSNIGLFFKSPILMPNDASIIFPIFLTLPHLCIISPCIRLHSAFFSAVQSTSIDGQSTMCGHTLRKLHTCNGDHIQQSSHCAGCDVTEIVIRQQHLGDVRGSHLVHIGPDTGGDGLAHL